MKKNTLNAKFGIAGRVGTASAFPTLHSFKYVMQKMLNYKHLLKRM